MVLQALNCPFHNFLLLRPTHMNCSPEFRIPFPYFPSTPANACDLYIKIQIALSIFLYYSGQCMWIIHKGIFFYSSIWRNGWGMWHHISPTSPALLSKVAAITFPSAKTKRKRNNQNNFETVYMGVRQKKPIESAQISLCYHREESIRLTLPPNAYVSASTSELVWGCVDQQICMSGYSCKL